MSQATLAFKVRKSRPQPTKECKESLVRSYPKRNRNAAPAITFTAVPLTENNPVLKENVSYTREKSPGKRLCLEPPGAVLF